MQSLRFIMAMGRRRLVLCGALLLGSAFLFVVQLRVLTYVCGNDPMLYQRAARVILRPSLYGTEAWREALTFVAPGYPLFLAAVIGIFGDLAPYWSNLVLLILLQPIMYFVLKRLTASRRMAVLCILCVWPLVFSGHPLHAPFMFYPFRESLRLFLVFCGYALLCVGVKERVRWWFCLGGSVVLLMACLVREPTALILPGVLLGILGLTRSWKVRLRAWGVFLAPWVILGLAGFVLLQFVSLVNLSQFSVIQYLRNPGVAIERGSQMLGWLPERVGGWLGATLIMIGIIASFKYGPVLLAWFLVPSITLFVFYSFMQMHDRYFLSSVLFLSVFAGVGLEMIWRFIEWGVNVLFRDERHRRILRYAVSAVVVLSLIISMLVVGKQVQHWGRDVSAKEIKVWKSFLETLETSPDGRLRIAIEQRCRYLEDLVLSYTDAELLDPKDIEGWPADWDMAYHFDPLNRQAEYATPQWLMYLKVYAKSLLQDRMNVIAVEESVPSLGGGEFALYQLTPWRNGTHSQSVVRNEGDVLLWLDWGAMPDGQKRTVSVRAEKLDPVEQNLEVTDGGLSAIYLSPALQNVTSLFVEVASDYMIPFAPVIGTSGQDRPYVLDLGSRRRISAYRLLKSKSVRHHVDKDYPVLGLDRTELIRAPAMIGRSNGVWQVQISGKGQNPDGFLVKIESDDMPTQLVRSGKGMHTFVFFMLQDSSANISLLSSRYPSETPHFVVKRIGFLPHTFSTQAEIGRNAQISQDENVNSR